MAVVELTVSDHVATLELNRPDALNAIDPEMQDALIHAWRTIANDPNIRVAIVCGAGDRAFSTGADLKKTMPPAHSYAATVFGKFSEENFLTGIVMDKPLICAIDGYALGGGLELALACDIRIASDRSRFGLPEVKVGSIPGGGGTQRLPRAISASDANLLLLTGDIIDAPEALRMGLISQMTAPDKLADAACAIAQRIAANAPLSVRAVKRLVRKGAAMPVEDAVELERHYWGILRDTEDRIEGRKAFKEKRKPIFKEQ